MQRSSRLSFATLVVVMVGSGGTAQAHPALSGFNPFSQSVLRETGRTPARTWLSLSETYALLPATQGHVLLSELDAEHHFPGSPGVALLLRIPWWTQFLSPQYKPDVDFGDIGMGVRVTLHRSDENRIRFFAGAVFFAPTRTDVSPIPGSIMGATFGKVSSESFVAVTKGWGKAFVLYALLGIFASWQGDPAVTLDYNVNGSYFVTPSIGLLLGLSGRTMLAATARPDRRGDTRIAGLGGASFRFASWGSLSTVLLFPASPARDLDFGALASTTVSF